MPELLDARLVVSFRAIGGPGRPFLERARALLARVAPLGAVHVGWDVLRLTFAFDPTTFPAVLELLTQPGLDTMTDEPAWAVGIAQGDLRTVQEEGSPLLSSGLLRWGPPFVAASALAGLARPGEILCAQTVPAVRSGELVTSGLRIARDGTLRVRGARIDKRQPWKKQARENLLRLVEPRLVSSHLPDVRLEPGAMVVVRADPGAGGTRVLRHVAEQFPRALIISPVGSGFEPLGALRRALGRSTGPRVNPLLLELSTPLDALLAGKGVSLEMASKLISAFLWPKVSGTNSALLVDDVKSIDPATLEACVRAVRTTPAFGLVVRIDRESALPSILGTLSLAAEHRVPSLSREGAEDVAAYVSNGALDAQARGRWGRLGGGNPLAIVEALTGAIASGDVAWSTDRASPRSRAAGRGKIEPAARWIRRRANAEPTPARAVLSLLAVIGGEANATLMTRVFERANIRIDVPATLSYLEQSRWVVRTQDATAKAGPWFALPTRTHRKALFTTLADDARRGLHFSIWRVAEEGEGIFGRVEGAWHAAQAGELKRASATFLEGAKFAATAHLEASTTQLVAFAQRIDPASVGEGEAVLTKAMERASHRPFPAVSFPPPPPGSSRGLVPVVAANVASTMAANVSDLGESGLPFEEPDSLIERALIFHRSDAPGSPIEEDDPEAAGWNLDDELPLAALASNPPLSGGSIPPTSAPGGQIAHRLGQLAKAALLSPDDAALERWVNGEDAQKESVAFSERMRAMARVDDGDIEDALRVLQKTRSELEPGDHRRRCQTSLALGVALSVAGRSHEAMLEAMDALARARQTSDERGSKACLAFLAKLYSSVSRDDDAARLLAGSA